MHLLVAYDVCTTAPAGARRLRRVARVCLDFGCRVQNSVFEIRVEDAELVALRMRLLDEIKLDEDSLRLYKLHGSFRDVVETHGIDKSIDFDGPLLV